MVRIERIEMRRGLLAIEYAVFIAIFIAAILGIAIYMKRAISGKWRESADTFGYGRQYEAGKTTATPYADYDQK